MLAVVRDPHDEVERAAGELAAHVPEAHRHQVRDGQSACDRRLRVGVQVDRGCLARSGPDVAEGGVHLAAAGGEIGRHRLRVPVDATLMRQPEPSQHGRTAGRGRCRVRCRGRVSEVAPQGDHLAPAGGEAEGR